MKEENTQHPLNAKPRRWLFNSETDYNNLGLEGLNFEKEQDQESLFNISQNRPDDQERIKKIEKLINPCLLPRARSRRKDLDNKLLFYVNPIDTNQRVMIKLDKEAKLALFASINLRLSYPPHSVLLLNSDDATTGLTLALTYPQHVFHLSEFNAGQQRLTQRNINANEEIVPNADFVTEIKGQYKSVIVQIQSHTSKSDVLGDVTTAFSALDKDGYFYLLIHKQQGGQKIVNYVEQIFGNQNTETKKGMGGYMLISAIKKEDSFIDEKILQLNNQIEFQVFGKTIIAETLDSLFSKEGLDGGTKLLLESTEERIAKSNKVLDLGCGWGAISMSVLNKKPSVHVTAIDILPKAVRATRENLKSLDIDVKNFQVICSHDPRLALDKGFDLVLSNPPYHERADILKELFRNTVSAMQKKGDMYIVVENTYLDKFVDVLQSSFGNVSVHAKQGSYTILKSKK